MPNHTETRHVPYTAQQMYDLVADIARYPEFIPWMSGTRIRSKEDHGDTQTLIADLIVSFTVFSESFGSKVILNPTTKTIHSSYIDGPFKHMNAEWRFIDKDEGGCDVQFTVDFAFKSLILQKTATMFFQTAVQKMVGAFQNRAQALYGT